MLGYDKGWRHIHGGGHDPGKARTGWGWSLGAALGVWCHSAVPWWSFQLDNESSIADTIFQFSTEELWLLPLRDLAVFHDGDASLHFGFTVGPVCFS